MLKVYKPRMFSVHGDTAWILGDGQTSFTVNLTSSLHMEKVLHFTQQYAHIAYLDSESLVVVYHHSRSRAGIPKIRIMSHTFECLQEVTSQHQCAGPQCVKCDTSNIVISDVGATDLEIVPSVCCMSVTDDGDWYDKWVLLLDLDSQPATGGLIIHTDTVFVLYSTLYSTPNTILQIGLDHGERLAVLSLPSGCPPLTGPLCGSGHVLYAACEGHNGMDIVELRLQGNWLTKIYRCDEVSLLFYINFNLNYF
jgi:hypothetical protein